MTDKKPCIIISERGTCGRLYTAISEQVSIIAFGDNYIALTHLLETFNYQITPLNSRFARTILDKLEGHRV